MSDIFANLGNAVTYGGMVAIVGLLIVFTGLIILIVMISIMANLINKIATRKQQPAPAPVPAPAPAPVQEAAPVEEESAVDDAELIAVIAAAIAAFDNSGKQLVVRKVRRVSGWNKSSREEQVCRF